MRFFVRKFPARSARVLASSCALALVAAFAVADASAQEAKWQGDLAAWRTQHAADLQKPAGWLSLTGLHWMEDGDNSFGSAVDNKIKLATGPAHLGVLRLDNKAVELLPPQGADFAPDFLIAGAAAKKQSIRVDPDDDKNAPHLTIGSLNMYVIRRADRFALRV